MARGQVLQIPSGSGQLVTTLTKEEKNSLAILNPNDGYIYIKMNGPATSDITQWDWKLPSQSYGLFPGPWQSIGLYYVDQSGSNRSADINVYDNDTKLVIPDIQAVGRAVALAGSALDISQGTTPANPPASTVRLWADGSGDLHILKPDGTDNIVYDSSNIGGAVLGGDLQGTINNGVVRLRQGSSVGGFDSVGGFQHGFFINGDEWMFWGNRANQWRWVSNGNSVEYMRLAANILDVQVQITGRQGINVAGQVAGNTIFSVSTVHANTSVDADTSVDAGNGSYYYMHNGGIFNRWNSGWGAMEFSHPVYSPVFISTTHTSAAGGYGFVGSAVRLWSSAAHEAWFTHTNGVRCLVNCGSLSLDDNGTIYFHSNKTVNCSLGYPNLVFTNCNIAIEFTATTGTLFLGARSTGWGLYREAGRIRYQATRHDFVKGDNSAYGEIVAATYTTSSAERGKLDIAVLDNALAYVLNDSLHGVSYTRIVEGTKDIGFIADYWEHILPQVTQRDNDDGTVIGMDYAKVGAITFEALKQYIKQTDDRLALLEAKL